jgi:predicted dehydrogenase
VKVALVGANGHGLHHRRHLETLPEAELVALCDTRPVVEPPEGVPVFGDLDELLSRTRPDILIVATPPVTHLPFAVKALRAGADVLLEKPPVLDLGEHHELSKVQSESGRAVQVGFQALTSPALPGLKALAPADVSVVGAWQRDDSYWTRSPWAGRLPLDGALRNPFSHAVMQALTVAGSVPVRAEVAWCRTRDIEVDDTATLRLSLANGHRILIAVTLATEQFIDGRLRVGETELDFRGEGSSLLANLIAHRQAGAALLAPLAATRAFTAVVQALAGMPRPALAPAERDGATLTLPGISEILRTCAAEFKLLNEIENPWSAIVSGGAATTG